MGHKPKEEIIKELKGFLDEFETLGVRVEDLNIHGFLAENGYDRDPDFVEIFDLAADFDLPKDLVENRPGQLKRLIELIKNL